MTNNPKKFCPNARDRTIDIDPASIQKTVRHIEVPLVGPVKPVLVDMIEMLNQMDVEPDQGFEGMVGDHQRLA